MLKLKQTNLMILLKKKKILNLKVNSNVVNNLRVERTRSIVESTRSIVECTRSIVKLHSQCETMSTFRN